MGSHRGGWIGSSMLAAALVLFPAATSVRAQPGFGPDPWWPYNYQYAPYTTPMIPGGPAGGMNFAGGNRGANRFQDYLDDLEPGPGRNVSDRSGIGMPYYRSAVDPSLETKEGRIARQYKPNSQTTESFDESQRRVADTYFQYYAERDPARRAELLREYREARRNAALAISGRGRSSSRPRDTSARSVSATGRSARTGSAAAREGGTDRPRARVDRFGPAPEVPSVGSRRSSTPTPIPRRSLPTEVLNRSRAMDRAEGVRPSSGSPGISSRPPSRGPGRPAPTPRATDLDNP